jgi:hypothetical protein
MRPKKIMWTGYIYIGSCKTADPDYVITASSYRNLKNWIVAHINSAKMVFDEPHCKIDILLGE